MTSHEILFIALMLIPIAVVGYHEYYGRKLGVSTAYSSRRMRQAILDELKAAFPGDKPIHIFDPGCGNGKLARYIARKLPHAHVTGVELSPLPYWHGKIRTKLFGPKNFTIIKQSYFDCDYAQADALIIFLLEPALAKLAPTLKQKLKPGAIILSNTSPLPVDWPPYKKDIVESFLQKRLYCYRIS